MIGTRLGPSEITAELGEGGMGAVDHTTDTRLKREVEIEVFPAAFTEDEEHLGASLPKREKQCQKRTSRFRGLW